MVKATKSGTISFNTKNYTDENISWCNGSVLLVNENNQAIIQLVDDDNMEIMSLMVSVEETIRLNLEKDNNIICFFGYDLDADEYEILHIENVNNKFNSTKS